MGPRAGSASTSRKSPRPHLEAEKLRRAACHGVGDQPHAVGADARGEQRLVGVAECRVGEQRAFLFARPLREFLRSQFEQALARARRRGDAPVEGRERGRLEQRCGLVALGLRVAVDRHVGEEMHQFRGAVPARLELEQGRRRVDERGCGVPRAEHGMRDHVLEERHVCLHAADAELAQRAVHALQGDGECLAGGGDLDEQRVVERREGAPGRSHAGIQPHTEARGAAVGEDLA